MGAIGRAATWRISGTALFGDTTGGTAVTVTLDSGRRLTALTFNTATQGGSYTISNTDGISGLTLTNHGLGVALAVIGGGNHTIAVPVTFGDTVNFTSDTGSLTISGNIDGGGGLTVAGNLILTGNNAYGGGTTINSGILTAIPASGSGLAVGTGPVTVDPGATLLTGGIGPLGPWNGPCNALTVNGGSVVVTQHGRHQLVPRPGAVDRRHDQFARPIGLAYQHDHDLRGALPRRRSTLSISTPLSPRTTPTFLLTLSSLAIPP